MNADEKLNSFGYILEPFMCVHMCVCVCVYMYIYIYIYIYVCVVFVCVFLEGYKNYFHEARTAETHSWLCCSSVHCAAVRVTL
jgi:hypothetical protein